MQTKEKQIINEKMKFTFLMTVMFSIFAHGFRYSNNLYSHDALLNVCQKDDSWQVSLGRFLQPLTMYLRGDIVTTWVIVIIAMVCYCFSVYLIIDILQIESRYMIALVAGVAVCNITITTANASFIPWLDMYGIALLSAVSGVYMCLKEKLWQNLLAILAFTVSLGMYQAYIDVALSLCVIVLIHKCIENEDFKAIIKMGIKMVVCFLIAGVLYYVLWQVALNLYQVAPADSYNGMADVGNFAGVSIIGLLWHAGKMFFDCQKNIDIFSIYNSLQIDLAMGWQKLIWLLTIFTGVFSFFSIIKLNLKKKTKWVNILFEMFGMICFLLAINFVYVISKGMEHALMIYSFQMPFIFAAAIAEWHNRANGEGELLKQGITDKTKLLDILQKVVTICLLVVMIWNNIVFSNQLYLKEELQEKATMSFMTRVVKDIEEFEGYIPGVTPVYFWGYVNSADCMIKLPDFEEITALGVGDSPITYHGTEAKFLTYFMNENINTLQTADILNAGVEEMPNYPAKDSIKMVKGVLVVKLSDM